MAKADEGAVTLTADQLKEVVQAAIAGALAATGTQRLVGKDFHAKVQAIKNKTGDFARAPKPLTPPPGYVILTDQFGQSPKIVEAHTVFHQGFTVKPFEQGKGGRKAPAHTGVYAGKLRDGSMKLKAFAPYPDGLVSFKGDQSELLPDFGTAENPQPMVGMLEKSGGCYYDRDYLNGTVKTAGKAAA